MPPRRFVRGWVLAWFASIGSIIAAIGPNIRGEYDANLAVLMLTLVALIWYTYFTYCSIHREDRTVILVAIEDDVGALSICLKPIVENRSPRTVDAYIRVQIWLNGEELERTSFYDAV